MQVSKKEEMTTRALPAVVDANYAVMELPAAELAEIIAANLGGEGITQFDLDRVRIPAGGSTTWSIPTLDGEEETRVLEGIIIHFTTPRAYWKTPFDESGGGTPPDCSSEDGIVGVGNPGGDCSTCPLSKFGTAKNRRGQACKQMRLLFMLREDSLLPIVVVLPPMSLRPARQYFLRLASQRQAFYSVITRIELERDRNQDGIPYSRAKFSVGGYLPPEKADFVKRLSERMRPIFETVTIDAQDVYADGDA